MPGSITVAVRNSPCHARNDGNVTGWLRAPCAVVNCACRSIAKPGDLSRQRGVVNRPLLPRLGAVHCGPTGLMMLPGGTPANLRLWRNSAASASRSSPAGPQTTRRSSCSRALRAADCQGRSSIIGPSTENTPRSSSITIRKNGCAGWFSFTPRYYQRDGSSRKGGAEAAHKGRSPRVPPPSLNVRLRDSHRLGLLGAPLSRARERSVISRHWR